MATMVIGGLTARELGGGPRAHQVVIARAERLGITPAQARLALLLEHSPATLLIPETRSLAHLADNVAVARIEFDPDAMTAFDALAQDEPA